jgi:hypothetical protein
LLPQRWAHRRDREFALVGYLMVGQFLFSRPPFDSHAQC